MTPAPEHWRRWKRGQRSARLAIPAVSLGRAPAANDRHFSQLKIWHLSLVLVAAVLIGAIVWFLWSQPTKSAAPAGASDSARRMTGKAACWIEAHSESERFDRQSTAPCLN